MASFTSLYCGSNEHHIKVNFDGSANKVFPQIQETIVVRNGKQLSIAVDKLVIGDIVEVKSGDRLPADIRIIQSAGFKVKKMLASNIFLS